MLKWCLSAVAAVGLCAMLGAQVPGGGGTSIACGSSKIIAHPAAIQIGYGATQQLACLAATVGLDAGLHEFGSDRCARCPGGGPAHCGGDNDVFASGPPPTTESHFDPILLVWVCTATLPAGSLLVVCSACPE